MDIPYTLIAATSAALLRKGCLDYSRFVSNLSQPDRRQHAVVVKQEM